jgi:hypothetical protein
MEGNGPTKPGAYRPAQLMARQKSRPAASPVAVWPGKIPTSPRWRAEFGPAKTGHLSKLAGVLIVLDAVRRAIGRLGS